MPDAQLFTPKTETDTVTPTPPVVPVPDALLHMISDAEAVVSSEVVTPIAPVSTSIDEPAQEAQPIIPETPAVTSVSSTEETATAHAPDVPVVPVQSAPAPVKNSDSRLE